MACLRYPHLIRLINPIIQESDKLSDEDLYRSLAEMKKSLAAFNRKTKSVPGNLKVDISSPDENMSCCLTSNLWEIDPFPDKRSRRPTREIEEFPTKEVYSPYTTYKLVQVKRVASM